MAESRKARFDRDGFLVVPRFAGPDAAAELRARAAEIVRAFDPSGPASARATEVTRDYYITSGDKVRCFFEAALIDERGELRRPKEQSVAKIGQAMHALDPAFERFSRDPRLHDLMVELGTEQPLIYQSMYLFKQPRVGGAVLWHRDAPHAGGEPIRVTTLWFALERADRANGCLAVRRGGHRAARPDDVSPELLEVDAGTLVVMDGLLPHASGPNRSARSRQACTLHVVGAEQPWPPDDWFAPVVPPRPMRGG